MVACITARVVFFSKVAAWMPEQQKGLGFEVNAVGLNHRGTRFVEKDKHKQRTF